ncbi:acetylornithine deacetylase/succinyl-diaminopimelate desuccinylase-like protein [Neobacillus niacini]|nr:acetylornithine deacetylase/succinyl-diaminopimelate desuccinylase-like protein [Neobacillus niacini]
MNDGTKTVLGEEPVVTTWTCCTNGSETSGHRNIPTIGMGPGSILQGHIVDEYIEIEQINKVTDIYLEFLKNWSPADLI